MTETIIAALISGGVAIIVCVITQAVQAATMRKLLEYRLEQLEKKVDKHNNLIERTYELEKEVAVLKDDMAKKC